MNAKKNGAKPANIRAKLKFPSVEKFVERYAPNISRAGIFVKTAKPRSVGTQVRFEFQIADGTPVMRGIGQVSWIRETTAGDKPAGMGIKFSKLDSKSRQILGQVLKWKESQAAERDVQSRYSDAPPPPPADQPGAEPQDPPEPAAAAAEPQGPPEPAAAAAEPDGPAPTKARARKGRRVGKSAKKVDLGAIDSMLADIASPARKKRRKKARKRKAEAVPIEAEEPAAEEEPETAEEEPETAEEEPETAEEEPAIIDGGATDIGSLIEEEIAGDEVAAAFDPDAEVSILAGDDANIADDVFSDMEDALADEPQPTISFMPEQAPDATEELDAQLESVLDSPLEEQAEISLEEEVEPIDTESILEIGADAPEISLADLDDELELLDDDLEEDLSEPVSDPVGALVDEIARESAEPPPAEPLLGNEDVADALEEFFSQATIADTTVPADEESDLPPDTLPDDAIPAGLVRQPAPAAAQPAAADGGEPTDQVDIPLGEDGAPVEGEDGQKKGFFKRLFSKK